MVRVSIVIATYNRAESMTRMLGSLAGQTLDPSMWEAIVVNNNSSDDTTAKFRNFAESHPHLNLKIVDEPQQGLSHARNRGIAESSAEYIVIIDDDEEVNPGFAGAYVDFFDTHPQAAAAGGKVIPLYEFETPKWLSGIVERPIAGTIDMGDRVKLFPREKYPGGGNMGARRRVFEELGAFDPALGRTGTKLLAGEEKDFFHRIKAAGEKIYYLPDAQILHIIPQSRVTLAYLKKATRMVGISERIRTKNISGWSYAKRLLSEAVKWAATFVLGLWHTLTLKPAKAQALFVLRYNISMGLLGYPASESK